MLLKTPSSKQMWPKMSNSSTIARDQIHEYFPIPSSVSLRAYFPSDTDFKQRFTSPSKLRLWIYHVKLRTLICPATQLQASRQHLESEQTEIFFKGQSFTVTGEHYLLGRSAGRTQCLIAVAAGWRHRHCFLSGPLFSKKRFASSSIGLLSEAQGRRTESQ